MNYKIIISFSSIATYWRENNSDTFIKTKPISEFSSHESYSLFNRATCEMKTTWAFNSEERTQNTKRERKNDAVPWKH